MAERKTPSLVSEMLPSPIAHGQNSDPTFSAEGSHVAGQSTSSRSELAHPALDKSSSIKVKDIPKVFIYIIHYIQGNYFLLNYLKSQSIILYIDTLWQHCWFVICSINRQAEYNFVLTLNKKLWVEGKLVSDLVASGSRSHSARAALIVTEPLH